jgi:hypothetical protein
MAETYNPANGIDISVPNVARMYDYWLGGKDHYAADREAADRSTAAIPQLPWMAQENRRFLGRAVRYCASQGITQFIDIGSGLPTMENVHQVASQVTDEPRVVYVDHDPVVVRHAQALLATPRTRALHGDLTRPADILDDAAASGVIDLTRPVAVLLIAILHFIPDEAGPADAVAALRQAIAPGSFLVISHVQLAAGQMDGDEPATKEARELTQARKGIPHGNGTRSRDEIAAFFGDMTLVPPGLAELWEWRPDPGPAAERSDVITFLGGVAKKG